MNLFGLRTACQTRSGWNDPAFASNWDLWLNESLREHARVSPWQGLEDLIDIVSTGSEYLVLPGHVDSIISILNVTTNSPVRRTGDWDRTQPFVYAQRTTGDVFEYDLIGVVPTIGDPAGYVVVRGSHASDTQNLYVTGLVANSGASGSALALSARTLSITATGISPQTLSTLFTRFTSIGKATNSQGEFFFNDAGASMAPLAWLGKYDDNSAYKRIQLLYKPAAQTTFRIRVRNKPEPLIDDAQAPHPAVKSDFLINHALHLFYASQEQLQKSGWQAQKASKILADETAKDSNHDEPHSQISPHLNYDPDAPYYWQ